MGGATSVVTPSGNQSKSLIKLIAQLWAINIRNSGRFNQSGTSQGLSAFFALTALTLLTRITLYWLTLTSKTSDNRFTLIAYNLGLNIYDYNAYLTFAELATAQEITYFASFQVSFA